MGRVAPARVQSRQSLTHFLLARGVRRSPTVHGQWFRQLPASGEAVMQTWGADPAVCAPTCQGLLSITPCW